MRHHTDPDPPPASGCAHFDPTASPAQQAWGALHRAMMGHRQFMMHRLAEQGVPPGQGMLLRELAHHDGVSQRDLAERLRVARPTVTIMLQKMERTGLVERRTDEHDQRLTRVFATEAGRELQRAMRGAFLDIADAAMGVLSEEEQLHLARLLDRVGDGLAEATGSDLPHVRPCRETESA